MGSTLLSRLVSIILYCLSLKKVRQGLNWWAYGKRKAENRLGRNASANRKEDFGKIETQTIANMTPTRSRRETKGLLILRLYQGAGTTWPFASSALFKSIACLNKTNMDGIHDLAPLSTRQEGLSKGLIFWNQLGNAMFVWKPGYGWPFLFAIAVKVTLSPTLKLCICLWWTQTFCWVCSNSLSTKEVLWRQDSTLQYSNGQSAECQPLHICHIYGIWDEELCTCDETIQARLEIYNSAGVSLVPKSVFCHSTSNYHSITGVPAAFQLTRNPRLASLPLELSSGENGKLWETSDNDHKVNRLQQWRHLVAERMLIPGSTAKGQICWCYIMWCLLLE